MLKFLKCLVQNRWQASFLRLKAGTTPVGRKQFTSIAMKSAVFTVLTCAISLGLTGWYFSEKEMDSLLQAAMERNNAVADRVSSEIGQYMLARKNFLLATGSLPAIQSGELTAMQASLQMLKPYYGSDPLAVAQADGQEIARTDSLPPENLGGQNYFQKAQQGAAVSFTATKMHGQPAIVGAMPLLTADHQVTGVLLGTISLGTIQTMTERILAQSPGYLITVVDQNRIPLFDQSNSAAVSEQQPLTEALYEQAVGNKTGSSIEFYRGQEYLVAYRPIENTDWTAVTFFPKQVALQPAYEGLKNSICVISFLIVLFALLGLVVTQYVLRPVKGLVRGVNQVSRGDLTYILTSNRQDEFGHISRAFGKMTQNLRALVTAVKQSTGQVVDSATCLTKVSSESSESSFQVSSAMLTMVDQMKEQGVKAATTEQHLHRLVALSGEVATGIEQVAGQAGTCSEAALSGRQAVEDTVKSMDSLRALMEKADETVRRLGDSIQEIGTITAMITGIAKQTNLLALNAAIEAARAGEAGRGFNVVADEVRSLADQSLQSVQKISGIIANIQCQTQEVMTVMEQSFDHVDDGAKVVTTLGPTFEKIVTAIADMKTQALGITAETDQQVRFCQEALEAVQGVSLLTAANNRSVNHIAATTQEQAAAAQKIDQSVGQLTELAENLNSAVANFKS